MTHTFVITPTSAYSYERSNNGCDEVFLIRSHVTGETVASIAFWDEKALAESQAMRLISALNTLHEVSADIDFVELAAAHHRVELDWTVENVKAVRHDLGHMQAWDVLDLAWKLHDRQHGFTKEIIERVAEYLFPIDGQGRLL